MKTSKQNNVVHMDTVAPLPARIRFEHIKDNGRWLTYTGTREDLINEGLATADMFPAGRKRVKREDEKYSSNWEVWKRFGDLFELRLPAPEPTEAPWDPARWKDDLYLSANRSFGYMWHEINSGPEQSWYGVATHRLSETDRQELLALFHDALDVIEQARVERANGPHCRIYVRDGSPPGGFLSILAIVFLRLNGKGLLAHVFFQRSPRNTKLVERVLFVVCLHFVGTVYHCLCLDYVLHP